MNFYGANVRAECYTIDENRFQSQLITIETGETLDRLQTSWYEDKGGKKIVLN